MSHHRITRRLALTSLGAGLGGTLLGPLRLRAEERTLPNFTFLVVSDTHLGRQDSDAPARKWKQMAQELATAEGDFVLHLGDIVDGGREKQYAVYQEIRKGIRKPVHEIPGNHDPQELFARHIRKEVDRAFDHQGVRFLLLNNSRPDSHDGFVSVQQLTWLGEQCADAGKKGLFVVLCLHVPVHANKHPDRGWYVKPKEGQAELYALLARHRERVLALLHGHFHNGIRGWDDHAPLQEVVCPSALYNQDRRLAEQKAPGYYLSELRPGFVQVTFQARAMRLRYKPLGAGEVVEKVCPLPQLKT